MRGHRRIGEIERARDEVASLRPWHEDDRLTRVLVAEPNRLYAEALTITLEADPELEPIGYALDGWEAVELTATLEPDAIVVCDGLTGLEPLALVRVVHRFWPRIRLILLAEKQVPREVEEAYAAGVADYLPTSRSADELVTAIGQACARRATQERASRRRFELLPLDRRSGGFDDD